ncbi:SEL1-like repeat protein [Bradyrhizobium sp. Pha-3]|uniref:SEL1-like repeat protein n=1 Tax=Bradyrhizobium sp. Pha-3 TaxID=208375 RepID=UPI0035D3F2B9
MYFYGKGTPRDYDTAAQYFQQAADLNDGYSVKSRESRRAAWQTSLGGDNSVI